VPDEPSDAMLNRLVADAQRALDALDPATRVDIIARYVQPYAGWALRWAIEDCRARGMPWTEIARVLDRPYTTVMRQVQAGGPVYVHQPAHSPGTRNFDAQTPLRRAATELGHRMTALTMTYPASITAIHLRDRVARLNAAQGVIDDGEPLLEATRVVLAGMNQIRRQAPVSPPGGMAPAEKAVWTILEELELIYRRDRPEIETAHRVMSDAAMLPKVSR
jgi:hypothetical protein